MVDLGITFEDLGDHGVEMGDHREALVNIGEVR